MQTPEKTLWGGRFSTNLTTETIAFTHSIEADTRLIGYDIWGSQAHAIMLARQGIIADADLREILRWLQKAEADFQNGDFTLDPNKEDVHMNVESYLIENAGREFGGKLHTARSRNDQVLVDAIFTFGMRFSMSSAVSPHSVRHSYTLRKYIPIPSCPVIRIPNTHNR